MKERLQKLLSQSGICSRRKAEEYIQSGRVMVNGVMAQLGDKASFEEDTVTVDGKPIAPEEKKLYIMLNKPKGFVTTMSDEKGRKTVWDLVKECQVRVWPVGRLDLNSEGLLIMTNDGDLTQRLIHPSHMIEKEYVTWVSGNVEKAVPILQTKIVDAGEVFLPAKVKVIRQFEHVSVISITIHEGKKHQVRRMCAHAALTVKRLIRVREGFLHLDKQLKKGEWRHLNESEIAQLTK